MKGERVQLRQKRCTESDVVGVGKRSTGVPGTSEEGIFNARFDSKRSRMLPTVSKPGH